MCKEGDLPKYDGSTAKNMFTRWRKRALPRDVAQVLTSSRCRMTFFWPKESRPPYPLDITTKRQQISYLKTQKMFE